MKNTLQFINRETANNPSLFVKSEEESYINEIYSIAGRIAENDAIKIVAIAGPSASGKTTTAHILCDRLKELGETPVVVSLDDFYLPVDRLPLLPDGRRDIESVNSLDISLIEKCFNEIISTGVSDLPVFDFSKKERRSNAKRIDISGGGIVIVEGLHALNPIITELVPHENYFKIYISVNSPVIDQNGTQLLSSRQLRFIRRALRDEIFRDTTVDKTLVLWKDVVEGEKKYLYCYKETADVQLKTLHLYEPCLYRNRFLAMRGELTPDSVCYDYFVSIAEALERFVPLDPSYVPRGSLVREFIGNGRYNT